MRIKYSEIIKHQPTTNIGTIGHVASGKSTLVYQITGIKTQKFSSEQDQNITEHIGYANTKIFRDKHNQLHTTTSNQDVLLDDDGDEMKLIKHISCVDCPGHENFMSNMINGSAVMNMCILVIASNENIPQPQTYEHLQAVESIDIDKYIILQNKLDLVYEDDNNDVLDDITKFINGTKAKDSKIIPTVVQRGVNVSQVIKSIVEFPEEDFEEKCNKPARLIIIRSFDINKPKRKYSELKGGIVGGSLVSGVLNKEEIVEMRPGFIQRQSDGTFKYRPILSKVVSLQSDTRQLDSAFPGGLIGVGLKIDPFITKNNGMVGQVLGHINTLPPVYMELTFIFDLIKRYDKIDVEFQKNENILLCVNAMRIEGKIDTYKKKKQLMTVKLNKPICLSLKQNISIFKMIDRVWKLVATGIPKSGKECQQSNIDETLYNELCQRNNIENIEIDNDIGNDISVNSFSYEKLLENIDFKDLRDQNINVRPPRVIYKHPKSVLINFQDVCKSVNLTPRDQLSIDYVDLIQKHLKKEFSCDGEFNGSNQLCLNGKFTDLMISNEIINFIDKYLRCFSCKSPLTYLLKKNKKLHRSCFTCNSVSCVNIK